MKLAIVGYGVEGDASYRYFSKDPDNDITIVDEKKELELPVGVKTMLGAGVLGKLADFDVIIRAPGIAPRKITTNGKIWSATNEFFEKCPAPIIGVTGSKGKGTTASLIASILEKAGKTVWLVGNIGRPALDVLGQIQPADIVVYELSSFQLWDLERSPQTAVILMIEQEHLDVHASMEEYVTAKAQIALHQKPGDLLVYNQTNQYATSIASQSPAEKVGYPDAATAHVADGSFYYGEQKICSTQALQIVGQHNWDNACAAIDATWQYSQAPEVIEAGLAAFTGLPHRLHLIDEVDGVRYYDDSIATTPSSAIAAIRAFDEPKIIILGGSSKGSDFHELAHELAEHHVRALLIGREGATIAQACNDQGFQDYELMDGDLEQAVRRAHEIAQPGSVVLLSPAAASFDMFRNYADRGEHFIAAVKALKS